MPVGPIVTRVCGALAALAFSGAIACAQTFPDRPVKLMIAFGSGGTIDTLGRILADKLSERWKQGVVVENKPGGGGNIGSAAAANAAPRKRQNMQISRNMSTWRHAGASAARTPSRAPSGAHLR